MIKGEMLAEKPKVKYRKLKGLNQGSLKTFSEGPMAFYKQCILGEEKEDEDTFSTLVGSLTDFYVLDCNGNETEFNQRFDEEYALFQGEKGSSQVFVLADELFKIAKKNIDEDGVIVGGDDKFTVMFQEAFLITQGIGKYKGKDWKKGLEDFNTNGKDYYNSLINNAGKRVVDVSMLEISKRIKDQLYSNENLQPLFVESDEYEIYNKLPIEFKYQGWDCKAELDKLVIDHNKKRIMPKDLKCVWDNENFGFSYLKRKYYIQNVWYWLAVSAWAKAQGLVHYRIFPMEFIVCDTSANKRLPLIYRTTEKHLSEAMSGFTHNGKYYKGVGQLVDELTWANDNQIWNITKENYDNKNVVHLPLFNQE